MDILPAALNLRILHLDEVLEEVDTDGLFASVAVHWHVVCERLHRVGLSNVGSTSVPLLRSMNVFWIASKSLMLFPVCSRL